MSLCNEECIKKHSKYLNISFSRAIFRIWFLFLSIILNLHFAPVFFWCKILFENCKKKMYKRDLNCVGVNNRCTSI